MEHKPVVVRPYGIVVKGHLELGVEAIFDADGTLLEIRPHTGLPEPFVLSPAFVNAHSHLEYRGLMGKVEGETYWDWIRAITQHKVAQSPEEVVADCLTAARENRDTGVAFIGEHSDRPGAAAALKEVGIDGVIYQELITFNESEAPAEKIASVTAKASASGVASGLPTFVSAHTAFTVDGLTLGSLRPPLSIHLAESAAENEFFETGTGPIADFYERFGKTVSAKGLSATGYLNSLGLLGPETQAVHCCALSPADIDLIARTGTKVVHCPRSNVALKCPPAPIRELLNRGVTVGLGLDSAASSGPIDMFAEMRAAIEVSQGRGKPISGEEVWRMATDIGLSSLVGSGLLSEIWEIGRSGPWIRIALTDALSTEDLVERGIPSIVLRQSTTTVS